MRAIASTLLLAIALVANPGAAVAADPTNAVVHLGHGTDDLHAVTMALKLAAGLQSKGARVTLLLDREGVRVADTRQPADLRWGQSAPVMELYEAFVAKGGVVLVCPHCAAAVGLDAKTLRPGAKLAASEAELAEALLAAGVVVDY